MTDITAVLPPKKQNNAVKVAAEILIVVILALIAASILNASLFTTTRVSGPSMNDTLYGGSIDGGIDVRQDTAFDKFFFGAPDEFGDKVLLLKTQKIRRGDIIVFHPSVAPQKQWIKRVVGVAGDTVTVKNGEVWLNGEKLAEAYVTGKTYYNHSISAKTWEVPEGCVFVMGDNRGNSEDSRVIGCVEKSAIVGRVALVVKKDTKKIILFKNL